MSEYIVAVDDTVVFELIRSMSRGEILAIREDGSVEAVLRKALVDKFNGLRVEIFANEHPPPHFRVRFQGSSANFRIDNCEMLNGSGEVLKYEKNVMLWWMKNKPSLIEFWNARRPSDCPVGIYRE